jgi:hypothetical protein
MMNNLNTLRSVRFVVCLCVIFDVDVVMFCCDFVDCSAIAGWSQTVGVDEVQLVVVVFIVVVVLKKLFLGESQ